MKSELLPPPPVPRHRAAIVWAELVDAGEAIMRAGLAHRFGAEHVEEQFRAWRLREIADHDRRIHHLLSELSRREAGDAG